VQIVINFPPKYSITKVVQIIKQNTGRALYEKFEFIRKRYWGQEGIWSVGYFVSTVCLDEKTILEYAKHQEREDLGQAKLALKESPDVSPGLVQIEINL
jgi:putative transposase